MRQARVRILWLLHSQGGRIQPPSGPVYAGVARFWQATGEMQSLWSVVLEFEPSDAQDYEVIAYARFLMPTGPEDLLVPNQMFEVLEGKRVVAKGVVLEIHAQ